MQFLLQLLDEISIYSASCFHDTYQIKKVLHMSSDVFPFFLTTSFLTHGLERKMDVHKWNK